MTRYIDADPLLEELKLSSNMHAENSREFSLLFRNIVIVNEQPTADVAPVRHGKWIDETFKPWGLVYHPFKCNLCGEHAEFASSYCPNCGARMDAERKEE